MFSTGRHGFLPASPRGSTGSPGPVLTRGSFSVQRACGVCLSDKCSCTSENRTHTSVVYQSNSCTTHINNQSTTGTSPSAVQTPRNKHRTHVTEHRMYICADAALRHVRCHAPAALSRVVGGASAFMSLRPRDTRPLRPGLERVGSSFQTPALIPYAILLLIVYYQNLNLRTLANTPIVVSVASVRVGGRRHKRASYGVGGGD